MTFVVREARAEDAGFVLDLFAKPHARRFTHGPASETAYLDQLAANNGDDSRMLIVERDGRPFGNVNFSVVEGWLMEIGVIAFAEQRTGAGLFAMKWLLQRGFNELGLHRAFLEVLEENSGARALYERIGFRAEGCYRDGYRAADGTYHNLIPYGLLASEALPR